MLIAGIVLLCAGILVSGIVFVLAIRNMGDEVEASFGQGQPLTDRELHPGFPELRRGRPVDDLLHDLLRNISQQRANSSRTLARHFKLMIPGALGGLLFFVGLGLIIFHFVMLTLDK